MQDRESLEKYEERLRQWEARLERDTRKFHWMMVGGIFGGFVMISALGIWVYLAYILAAQ
ncbi:MAG TPA: hypothetical protein VIC53_04040 [Wenzhouxiangella sp.]